MNDTVNKKFDPTLAIEYGKLVDVAYGMYSHSDPVTPKFPGFPGYNFVAWVQMKDFLLNETPFYFYGFIVQRQNDLNCFVLVFRGTDDTLELYDDLKAVRLIPLAAPLEGQVGDGFERIFKTLRVMEADGTVTDEFGTGMDFTKQVAAAIEKCVSKDSSPTPSQAARSIEVTGHSLGSALATLYVARNAKDTKLHIPLLCTFASPLVGDTQFANWFDQLGINSWRIVNTADVVPQVPFPALGFKHIEEEHAYPAPDVNPNIPCWHEMHTYLHLLDAMFPLDWDCNANIPHGPDWS